LEFFRTHRFRDIGFGESYAQIDWTNPQYPGALKAVVAYIFGSSIAPDPQMTSYSRLIPYPVASSWRPIFAFSI
jgi:hypothetical protein